MKKIVATLILMFASFNSYAATLYNQELDSNIGFGSLFSTVGGQIGADGFILPQDSVITDISWYGYFGNDLAPSVSSLSFQIGIYSDNLGLPNSTPYYSQVSLATVSNTGQLVNEGIFTGLTIYEFATTLSSPLAVSAGELNWISIAKEWSDNVFISMLWSESPTQSSGTSAIAYKNTNVNNPSDWSIDPNRDLAFSLNGNISEVPVPPALLLFGTGLLGLAGYSRRRKAA